MKNKLEFGDIVIANRPGVAKEGHKTGPYIIIKIINDDVYALYGTSKKKKNIRRYFSINGSDYNIGDKIGYFDFDIKQINITDILERRSTLDKLDLKYIERKLSIINKYKNESDKLYFLEDVSINIGDIIDTRKNKYLVIDILENEFSCLKIKIINNKYEIDYSNIVNIPKADSYIQRDTLNYKLLKPIFLKLKKELEKDKSVVERGILVKKEDLLYYVYNKSNNLVDVFKVYNKNDVMDNEIKIHGKIYKTNYELFSFDVKDLIIVDRATDNEADLIKKQKKSYVKETKEKNKKVDNKKIVIGTIVISNSIFKKKYIVLSKSSNEVYALDYYEYLKGNIKINTLNSNHLIYKGKLDNEEVIKMIDIVNDTFLSSDISLEGMKKI